jgi:hypothetical protein
MTAYQWAGWLRLITVFAITSDRLRRRADGELGVAVPVSVGRSPRSGVGLVTPDAPLMHRAKDRLQVAHAIEEELLPPGHQYARDRRH